MKTLIALLLAGYTLTSPATETPQTSETTEKQKLVVVTSFPSEMTSLFEAAFEKKNPLVDVEIIKKKTTVGISYLETNPADLFWVSAPDAFEVLKSRKQLQRYHPSAKGIPRRISGYPVNDPDGFYTGFSAAGYGIMWNTDYLQAHQLDTPAKWLDLARPEYFGHIVLSAPSRSGTTHLTVEAILQLNGWERGWSIIKSIAGNTQSITKKSSHVPKAVIAGDAGLGIVIDYYGLSALARGNPIDFTYPPSTVFVPANIGILAKATNTKLAKHFIEFLLSQTGQELLLDPRVGRLPILPTTYFSPKAPAGFPQPYRSKPLGSNTAYDVLTSQLRYTLVNSLFDTMITYQIGALQKVTHLLHQAERRLKNHPATAMPELTTAIIRARDLIDYLPVSELSSHDPKFTALFTKNRKKIEDSNGGQQGRLENIWSER
ncbi:MAG: extracellular solute-binding protein, partial [Gammaproteobacteria bacterium]